MKIEKNKIVFALVILCVVLFIGAYYMITFGGDDDNEINTNQIPIPELEASQDQYKTKLEALDDLKEEREKTAPSLYPDHMIDEKGYFNPAYIEYEKQRIIDSIYQKEEAQQEERAYHNEDIKFFEQHSIDVKEKDSILIVNSENQINILKELDLGHQLFFASNPKEVIDLINHTRDMQIPVRVDGTQTVKKDYRLRLRLIRDAIINNKIIPRNTIVYGFVNFKPNRALVEIENIDHLPVKLKAYDFQDGSEGIYIVNNLQSEVRQQVVGETIDDINIAGVPQVNGIKKIFQRNIKNIKITVLNNYRLILKQTL